jgi:uncharacterized protein (DUF433 family)
MFDHDSLAVSPSRETAELVQTMTNWKDRIVVDPEILAGNPIIKGTRISVDLIMDRLADGWTLEDILAAYPRVTRADVLAAIGFVTEVFREMGDVALRKASAAGIARPSGRARIETNMIATWGTPQPTSCST